MYIFMKIHICLHSKLEIALLIRASKKGEIETNYSISGKLNINMETYGHCSHSSAI